MDTRGGAAIVADLPVDDPGDGDDRRHFAVALLVLAVLGALCIPGLLGRHTQGRAAAAPAAPAPEAGQCRAPMERPTDRDRVIGMPVVSCADPHSAEIVFVGEFGPDAAYPQTLQAPQLTGLEQACRQQVNSFLGVVGDGTVAPGGRVPHVVPQSRVQVTAPSPHQWGSGQRWYSCQVLPAGRELPITYTGSVQGAAAGPMPVEFARCAQVIGGDPVPCSRPHRAEKISATVRMHRGDHLECEPIARSVMKTDDPSYGFQVSNTSWGEPDGRACWATSTTGLRFVGSLVGWGDGPLDLQ